MQRNLAIAAMDRNPKHKVISVARPERSGALPPTNADVFGDYAGNGGEEFVDDPLDLQLVERPKNTLDNKLGDKKIKNQKRDEAPSEIPSRTVNTAGSLDSRNLLRSTRSIGSINLWADDIDASDEVRLKEAEEMRKLGLLHTVNDTRDVSAGNSSISSSEEFMEQCTSTILHVDIKSLVDCQQQQVDKDPKNWHFRINETDDYFFIFMSDNSLEENVVKYYLEVERVMYNISDNKDACTNSTECVFPIKFLSSESVVVELVDPDEQSAQPLTNLQNYEMQAVCQPRVAVYMVFILMVPFIILMFAFQ